MSEYIDVIEVEDITDEIIEVVYSVVDGWYSDGRIDWEDLLCRVETTPIEDGRKINFGDSLDSPAIRRIKRLVREYRKS
jgi:hypothetical protein